MRLLSSSLWALVSSSVLLAQHPGRDKAAAAARAIAALRRATVTVDAVQGDGSASGSGFILTPEGLIATAAHVVRGAKSATVKLQSGETFEAQGVAAIDDDRDFALIRVAGFGLPTVALGNSDSVEIGQRLIAVGAPLGLEATVSDGLLSGVRLVAGTRVYQISIPVSPGSSGGPVATEDGKVVGIVVNAIQADGAENLNFALPINYLRGQVALVTNRAPMPLVQMTYPPRLASDSGLLTRTPPAGLRTMDSIPTVLAPSPRVVNDSLGVDWQVLDGVEVASEVKPENGVHVMSVSDYASGRAPSGASTIESHVTTLWWQSADTWVSGKAGSWFHDQVRTVVRLGEPGAEVFFQRTAVGGRSDAGSFTLKISADTVVLDSAWSQRAGHVPRGTLPFSALDMAIAALPDSLPSSFYVWVLARNGWPAQLVWARVDFGQHRSTDVPIARPESNCDGGHYHTRSTRMDVVDATTTIGARTLTSVVLARRPHVDVSNAKCVRIAEPGAPQ